MATRRNKQIDQGKPDSPGRVAVDSRGRNVWQWEDDQLDSTTIMLQSLDNSALALEPTRQVRRPTVEGESTSGKSKSRTSQPADEQTPKKTTELSVEQTISSEDGGDFDPYNSS